MNDNENKNKQKYEKKEEDISALLRMRWYVDN